MPSMPRMISFRSPCQACPRWQLSSEAIPASNASAASRKGPFFRAVHLLPSQMCADTPLRPAKGTRNIKPLKNLRCEVIKMCELEMILVSLS